MAALHGTHGTSFSRAQSIQAGGFSVTTKGRGGTGAYFWKKGYHAEYLAIAWYDWKRAKGCYNNDEEQDGAIIFVQLSARSTEYLNAEHQSVKDSLAILAKKNQIKGTNTLELAWLHDLFIMELEKDLGTHYKVIEVRVATPPKEFVPDYQIRVSGAPLCFVARDATCISIERIRRIDHGTGNGKI